MIVIIMENNKLLNRKCFCDKLTIFIVISSIGILSYAVLLLCIPEKMALWLVMEHNYDWQFSDYFRQIVYASDLKNIYFNTSDAPFGPLAYIVYHFLYLINPFQLPIDISSWQTAELTNFNLLVFLIRTIFIMTALYFAIHSLLKKDYSDRTLFLFWTLLLLSAPFLSGVIERGNCAVVVLTLLVWALYLRDSEKPLNKELALLFIAIAAAIKIYPAVFGLLYIVEKRWKEAIRLFIYGLFFFFVPFTFTGGFQGLVQYLKVIFGGGFYGSNICKFTSIRCYFLAVMQVLGYSIEDNTIIRIGIILETVFLVSCIFSLFKQKKGWKCFLFISGVLSLYVSNSFRYVSIYMLIPLLAFLRECKSFKSKSDYVYCILFAMIFTIPTWGCIFNVGADPVIFLPIYLIMLWAFLDVWIFGIKKSNMPN